MLNNRHLAWLARHPERSEDWLERTVNTGLHDVVTLDGNVLNISPENLIFMDVNDIPLLRAFRMRLVASPNTIDRARTIVRQIDKLRIGGKSLPLAASEMGISRSSYFRFKRLLKDCKQVQEAPK